MKELPTLQEAIVKKAKKKLNDDIKKFCEELDTFCNHHHDIVVAVSFPYSKDPADECSIDNLFHKISVEDKIRENLLPSYVEREVTKIVEAINRIPEPSKKE